MIYEGNKGHHINKKDKSVIESKQICRAVEKENV